MKPLLWIAVGCGLGIGATWLLGKLSAPAPGDPYQPSASEVPIRQDYEATAERMVRPDNYRAQLAKIEKDLLDLSRKEDP
jgi:hypothetical protein